MSDIKWFKITTDMFEDEKLRLIDALPERDTIHYVWIRLLAQAGKTNANGFIFLNENIPYTEEMISTIFNRPINSIRLAISTLVKFSMISIEEDMTIKIINWDKYQNVQGMDRIREQTKKRVANCRSKQKSNKPKGEEEGNTPVKESNVTEEECNATVTQQRESKSKKEEIEREEELDIEIEREKEDLEALEGKEEVERIKKDSFKVLAYYERLTGTLGVFSLGALNLAIAQHGEEYVCKAIDKSLEVNKVNMTYVNGILKNWRREGYPNKEVQHNNGKSMLSNGNEFKDFKPKKSRQLSVEERCRSEGKLI